MLALTTACSGPPPAHKPFDAERFMATQGLIMQLRVCLGRPLTADEVARVRPMDDYHTQNYFRTLAHSEKQIECQYEAIVDCETATPGLCFAQREENP